MLCVAVDRFGDHCCRRARENQNHDWDQQRHDLRWFSRACGKQMRRWMQQSSNDPECKVRRQQSAFILIHDGLGVWAVSSLVDDWPFIARWKRSPVLEMLEMQRSFLKKPIENFARYDSFVRPECHLNRFVAVAEESFSYGLPADI